MSGKQGEWRKWGPAACLILAAAGAFHCNKTGGLNSNKASLLVVNTAPGKPALDVGKDEMPFASFLDSPVSYGFVTGTVPDPKHPYIFQAAYHQVDVGVKKINIESADGEIFSTGNTTFSYGRSYTMFLFDDSIPTTKSGMPQKDSVLLYILPDNIISSVDTFAYLRWMNFSPGSSYYNFQIRSVRPDDSITGAGGDTINTGFLNFVGNSETISQYAFKRVHSGSYQVLVDTGYNRTTGVYNPLVILPDSLFLVRDKSYTAFVQGYYDSAGDKKLRLRVIQHN